MKSLIVAVLLVLAVPAFASPRHPTSMQRADIRTFERAWTTCGGFDGDESSFREAYNGRYSYAELKNFCDVADRLGKKLMAQGFCTMGHIAVGRAGKPMTGVKGRRHCYIIHELAP